MLVTPCGMIMGILWTFSSAISSKLNIINYLLWDSECVYLENQNNIRTHFYLCYHHIRRKHVVHSEKKIHIFFEWESGTIGDRIRLQ